MPLLLYCTSLFVTHLYRIAIERAYAKLHRPYGNYGFSKATVDYTGSLPTCWPGTHKGWSSITGTILQVPHLASASSQEWYGFVQHPPRNFGNSSGPVDNDRQPTYTSPSGPLPAAPRAELRYWGTGAELRCGALEVCQKEVAGSVPGFWILFSFFNVSFESHWLDARR